MPLESASYISDLEVSNPAGTDQLSQGDEHIRLIKTVLKATFPSITGPVTKTQAQLNAAAYEPPIGIISLWYGSSGTVPAGWTICDGKTIARTDGAGNITVPDLRDKVVVGAGTGIAAQGVSAGSTTSAATTSSDGSHTHTITGGAHTHTASSGSTALTVDQLPPHGHLLTANGVSNLTLDSTNYLSQQRTAGGDSDYLINGTSSVPNIGNTSLTGAGSGHSHTVTVDSNTHSHTNSTEGVHSHSLTVSTVQPCMGLHYIMKY